MKKTHSSFGILFLGLLPILSGKISAQITITSADMPKANNIIYTSVDTTTSSFSRLSRPASGANIRWDYSSLPTTYTDTDVLSIPSITPYAHEFPSATMADSSYGTFGYTYYVTTDSSYSKENIPQVIRLNGDIITTFDSYTPPLLQLKLPAHYGDNDSGTVTGTSPAFPTKGIRGVDSGKFVVISFYRDTIDGYGTITTPLSGGAAYNALCQKHYQLDIYELYFYIPGYDWVQETTFNTKTYAYNWYAKDVGYSVAAMSMDSTDTQVNSFQWYTGHVTGIDELRQQQNALVYPNPCTSQITFRYNQGNAQNVFAYDITGRLLGHAEIENGTGILNTSDYSAGMYFYHITDKSGNVIDVGKFIVF